MYPLFTTTPQLARKTLKDSDKSGSAKKIIRAPSRRAVPSGLMPDRYSCNAFAWASGSSPSGFAITRRAVPDGQDSDVLHGIPSKSVVPSGTVTDSSDAAHRSVSTL